MPIYKVQYSREAVRTMKVEASSEEEALQKYEDFECIEDYEQYGLREKVMKVDKVEDKDAQ